MLEEILHFEPQREGNVSSRFFPILAEVLTFLLQMLLNRWNSCQLYEIQGCEHQD